MLLKSLLPAPGAEHNSYLKNASKKSQLFFFPISGKLKQTNDNNKKKKEKNKQPAVIEGMKIKKERSQSRGLVIKPSHSGAFPLFVLLMIKIT